MSTESGFKKGQVVEVGYTSSSSTGDSETYYWLASIVTPCGQLLGLHYIEDSWTEGKTHSMFLCWECFEVVI